MNIPEDIVSNYKEYAESNGFKLNPEEQVVERIIKGLLDRQKQYGVRYCPCRRITGNQEEDKKKICPCFWHKKEIEEMGLCHCGLFAKG